MNIPVFAMIDTNANPRLVDFPIPANDDATKSIAVILDAVCGAIKEGLEDRKNSKDAPSDEEDVVETKDTKAPKVAEVVEAVAPVTEEVSGEVADETEEA